MLNEREIRALCLELLDTAWPTYLTTIDANGYPQTRAMFNLRNRNRFPELIPLFENHCEDFMILFGTNTSSPKLLEITKNPATSVYFCIPEKSRGAMFGGDLQIVDDMELKKALWQDGWERYYPDGVEDPDYTVLKIFPRVVKGWTGSSTFRLEIGEKQ